MKNFSVKSIISGLFGLVVAISFASQVSAMTPTLSLVSNGTGSAQVSVYADANSSVLLNYYSNGQLMGAGVIGTTNYSGYFSTTLNTYSYPIIPSGAQVVVSVNGQQSIPATWMSNGYGGTQYPNYNGGPALSQANVSMTVGQNQTITVNSNSGYYTSGQFYIANNANNVVSATISGNTVNLYASSVGTTTLSVCSNSLVNTISYGLGNYNAGCTTLYVTVTGSYNNYPTYPTYPSYPTYPTYPTYPQYNTPLSVSNSNVQVTVGNNGVVSLYGNSYNTGYPYASNGSYYVTNNGNAIASATVNGNVLSIYGMSAGSTNVTVCATDSNQCATVYVTVIAPYYTNNGGYNQYPPYPYGNGNNWYWSDYQHCWLQH